MGTITESHHLSTSASWGPRCSRRFTSLALVGRRAGRPVPGGPVTWASRPRGLAEAPAGADGEHEVRIGFGGSMEEV
jgi:hypothetical protein